MLDPGLYLAMSAEMMMMAVVMSVVTVRPGGIVTNNVEMSHHTCLMVFQDMTMVHPTPGPIARYPRNFNLASGRKIYCILPANERRRFAIDFKNLKEKTMEMEGMIH